MTIRYNKSKCQFNLVDSGRHYIFKIDREHEILHMDKWLMSGTTPLYITFKTIEGIKYKNASVKTNSMFTWYNGKGLGDYKTFFWDFPTKFGHVYVHPYSGKCYFGASLTDKLPIKSECVHITNTIS